MKVLIFGVQKYKTGNRHFYFIFSEFEILFLYSILSQAF